MIDILTLKQTPVLDVVDRDTLFSATTFLHDQVDTKSVWDAFIRIWVAAYAGYPEQLHADQRKSLQSQEWKEMMRDAGIRPLDSGIESHNSLGAGERCHMMLLQSFRVIRMDHPGIPVDLALALAVWAMNQTAVPAGVSPHSLVLGVNPRIPVRPADLPDHRERCNANVEARAAMPKMVAQARLSKAFRQRVPRAVGKEIGPGKRVLVYREIPKKLESPYMVAGSDGKLVWLNVNNILKLFSVDKVQLYKPPITPATADEGPSATAAATTTNTPGVAVTNSSGTPRAGATDPTGDGTGTVAFNVADGISAAGVIFNSVYRHIGLVSLSRLRAAPSEEDERSSTFMKEVLEPGDPRASIPGMEAAIQAEADGLKRRGVWSKVLEEYVPAKANIFGTRFVNAIKEPNSDADTYKARYVAQGCGDKDKPFIVHNLSTLRQSSTKVIFLTSTRNDAMARELYVRVRKIHTKYFELKAGELLRWRKQLYGTADAGAYWDATFVLHVKEDLGVEPLTGDPALFVKMDGGAPEGMLGAYMEDSCMGGNEKFHGLTLATLDKFESKTARLGRLPVHRRLRADTSGSTAVFRS